MSALLDNLRTLRDPGLDADRLAAEHLQAQQLAEEAALADVDGFTDWLVGECSTSHHELLGAVPLDPHRIDFEAKTTPRLVALLLYPNQRIAGAAAYVLRERYLMARGIAP